MKDFFFFKANMKRMPFNIIVLVKIAIFVSAAFSDVGALFFGLTYILILYVSGCAYKARLNDMGYSGWWMLPAMLVILATSKLSEGAEDPSVFFVHVAGMMPLFLMMCLPTADPATNKYYIPKE